MVHKWIPLLFINEKMIKRCLLRGVIGVMGLLQLGPAFCFSIDDVVKEPYDDRATEQGNEATDIGNQLKENGVDPDDSASERIQDNLGTAYDAEKDQRATYYIKEVINGFLAFTGLVALVVLIFGFYKMFVAGDNQEAFSEAMKYVKGATIALLVIGFSRFIVSWMFEIFFQASDTVVAG